MGASLALLTGLLTLCTPFPTRYDRIEPNKLRPISFVYTPASEGAPGDTMRLRAYFAGDSLASADWSMSYDVVTTDYGVDTALNIFAIEPVGAAHWLPDSVEISFVVPESTFYKTVAITDDVFGQIARYLPEEARDLTRTDIIRLVEGLAALDFGDPAALAAFYAEWGALLGGAGATPESMTAFAGVVLSFLSVKAYVFADLASQSGRRLSVKSDFVIRYNSRFRGTPLAAAVSYNRNPRIRWMGIYRVAGSNLFSFDPADPAFRGKYTLQYLYNERDGEGVDDLVEIDTGCSYFVAVDSGSSPRFDLTRSSAPRFAVYDTGHAVISWGSVRLFTPVFPGETLSVPFTPGTGRTVIGARGTQPFFFVAGARTPLISGVVDGMVEIDTSGGVSAPVAAPAAQVEYYFTTRDVGATTMGTVGQEVYFYDWFLQNLDLDSTVLALDSMALLMPTGNAITPLLTPADPNMTMARVWAVAYDFFLGEINRPVGFATVHADVRFSYTGAYRESKRRK